MFAGFRTSSSGRRTGRLVPVVLAGALAAGLSGTLSAAPASAHGTTATKVRTASGVMPILRYGSKGAAVRTLQARLRIVVDGDFGPRTLTAVKALQRNRRLSPDGVVGPATWRSLGFNGGPVAQPRRAAPAPARPIVGRFANGRIPGTALCRVAWAPHEALRCDAYARIGQLNAAYRARFGQNLSVTDGYRSIQDQIRLKRTRGRFAARPGTSNHGWAVAVDLGGGVNRFGTAQHNWMRANAGRFGWVHPTWARQGGRTPEAWHWEFRG